MYNTMETTKMDVATFCMYVESLSNEIKEHHTTKTTRTGKTGASGQPLNPKNHIEKLIAAHGIQKAQPASDLVNVIIKGITTGNPDALPEQLFLNINSWGYKTKALVLESISKVVQYKPIDELVNQILIANSSNMATFQKHITKCKTAYTKAFKESCEANKAISDTQSVNQNNSEDDVEPNEDFVVADKRSTVTVVKQGQDECEQKCTETKDTSSVVVNAVFDKKDKMILDLTTQNEVLKGKIEVLHEKIRMLEQISQRHMDDANRFWEHIKVLTTPVIKPSSPSVS